MLIVLSWYLIISILAWISFPIAYRFLGNLPDKGFSLSRPIAMLIWAFIFWILGSFGILNNDLGGLFFAFILFAALSYWIFRGLPKGEIQRWLREKALMVLAMEALFLIAFFAMVLLRANNPNALGTEKPMELAFLNSILQSPSMPPNDPWLSGYAISYYYFGYLMVSMIAQVAATAGGIAFNLGLALIFGMAAMGSYGLAYNLLNVIRADKQRSNVWAAFLAPLFVLVMGNVEGFLEILHSQHIFWDLDANGQQVSTFWSWLDIRELVNPPTAEAALQPRSYGTGSWWWWRASRVINDVNFLGFEQEVIDEFPAFSFVLGDLHPHVFSIPFSFLAMNLSFNMYLADSKRKIQDAFLGLQINWQSLLFAILVIGGLAFLNVWDFPIYLVLFSGSYVFWRAKVEGWSWEKINDFLRVFVTVGIGGVLLYLPFYLGFSSQAGGFLPNLLNPTRGAHLWVMFGTLMLPILVYYLYLWLEDNLSYSYFRGFLISGIFLFALWILTLLLTWIFATLLKDSALGISILNGLGAPDVQSLFNASFTRRIANSGGWITMLILLALPLGYLINKGKNRQSKKKNAQDSESGKTFLLILGIFAILLVIAPEFIYLRDNFGTRMNMVFKFYMQAWLVLASLAAVVTVMLFSRSSGFKRVFMGLVLFSGIGIGLIYPAFAFSDRYRSVEGVAATLDGSSYLSDAEREAVDWLKNAPIGTLVEAVGGQYSLNAHFATNSGQQGLLGWPGHEGQWRGDSVNFYAREGDIELLYSSSNWSRAKEIIDRYEISYVIVSSFERSAYQLNETKFQNNLDLAFQNDAVQIYLAR